MRACCYSTNWAAATSASNQLLIRPTQSGCRPGTRSDDRSSWRLSMNRAETGRLGYAAPSRNRVQRFWRWLPPMGSTTSALTCNRVWDPHQQPFGDFFPLCIRYLRFNSVTHGNWTACRHHPLGPLDADRGDKGPLWRLIVATKPTARSARRGRERLPRLPVVAALSEQASRRILPA